MEEPSPAGVAVLAFYYETQRNGLVTDMESQCKTHCLTPFREVWPTTGSVANHGPLHFCAALL